MPRYIDADALKRKVNDLSAHLLCEWDTIGVLSLIDEQPTVDVRENVHGSWVDGEIVYEEGSNNE